MFLISSNPCIGTDPPRERTAVVYVNSKHWAISGSIHPKEDPADRLARHAHHPLSHSSPNVTTHPPSTPRTVRQLFSRAALWGQVHCRHTGVPRLQEIVPLKNRQHLTPALSRFKKIGPTGLSLRFLNQEIVGPTGFPGFLRINQSQTERILCRK